MEPRPLEPTESRLLCDGQPLLLQFSERNYWCALCHRQATSAALFLEHVQSARHRDAVRKGVESGRVRRWRHPCARLVCEDVPNACRAAGRAIWSVACLSLAKLITRQDRAHVHKVLALCCLYNFATKLAALLRTGTMEVCDGWLLAHAALPLSSFRFIVPGRGDAVNQGFITREVRLHTSLFSLRQLAAVALQLACGRGWLGARARRPPPLAIALVCLPFHALVDLSTARHGAERVTSIRGDHSELPTRSRAEVCVRAVLSALQFINNHALLRSAERCAETAFLFLAIIQLNAFLMTLRKKQILGPYGLLYAYFALIAVGTALNLGLVARSALHSLALGSGLYVLRRRGWSKYALWAACVAASQLAESVGPTGGRTELGSAAFLFAPVVRRVQELVPAKWPEYYVVAICLWLRPRGSDSRYKV